MQGANEVGLYKTTVEESLVLALKKKNPVCGRYHGRTSDNNRQSFWAAKTGHGVLKSIIKLNTGSGGEKRPSPVCQHFDRPARE